MMSGSTFFLKDVFGLLTLQTCTILFSSMFITLAVSVLLKNVLLIDAETPVAWIIMFLFVLFLATIWLIAFLGAFHESYETTSVAAISWTVYILIWAGLVVWSLMNTQNNKHICLEYTSPDGLWLLYNSRCVLYVENQLIESHKLTTKKQWENERPLYDQTVTPNTPGIRRRMGPPKEGKRSRNRTACVPRSTSPMKAVKNANRELVEDAEIYHANDIDVTADKSNESFSEPKCDLLSTIASIIVSILYAIVLMCSWLVLISYCKRFKPNPTTGDQEIPSTSQLRAQ